MFDYTKQQHEDFKSEVKKLMHRLLTHCHSVDALSNLIVEPRPLNKVYDVFLDAVKDNNAPLVVLSDSSVRGNVSGGDGGNGGEGEDTDSFSSI